MATAYFKIVRSSDNELFQCLCRTRDAFPNQHTKFRYRFLSVPAEQELDGADFENQPVFDFIHVSECRVFVHVRLLVGSSTITVTRGDRTHNTDQTDNNDVFDQISVAAEPASDLPELLAVVQNAFSHLPVASLGSFLGESAKHHFEARDAALAKLELLAGSLIHDIERVRRQRDEEIDRKRSEFEESHEAKVLGLDEWKKAEEEKVRLRAEELDKREASLNLQAPKTERRRVFDALQKDFSDWGKSFKLSDGPATNRLPAHLAFGAVILFLGGWTWYFMSRSVDRVASVAPNGGITTPEAIFLFARTGIFLLLTVSFVAVYLRWMNSWQQKHAEEEFRLKRLQLDSKRAHWFVELAFQWKDEFKEGVPPELVDRLTRNLFEDVGDGAKQDDRYEPLLKALLCVDSKLTVTPSGPQLELGKNGTQALSKHLTKPAE